MLYFNTNLQFAHISHHMLTQVSGAQLLYFNTQ